MYLRFVVENEKNPDTGVEDGVFSRAYALNRNGNLSKFEREELSIVLDWFDENLDLPSRFNKTKSKGYKGRKATKGVSWLKSSATKHIAMMRRLAAVLKNHCVPTTMIKTSRPGYVVYEDDYQVVAEPFNELRR